MSTQATEFVRIRSLIAKAPRGAASGACVLAAALAMIALPAAASTYKWTDANGRVIYSDQPPTGNFKVQAISAPPPPANPNAAKELASKEAELQQKKLLRADGEAKAAKARVESNQKRELCGKVRGQVAMMQSEQNVLLYRANEKGQQVYMDDAARRKEREQLEAWIRENCAA